MFCVKMDVTRFVFYDATSLLLHFYGIPTVIPARQCASMLHLRAFLADYNTGSKDRGLGFSVSLPVADDLASPDPGKE